MSDYKIHIDRKVPSDEQIEKRMNFEALLNQYHQQTGTPPKATQFVPLYKRKYTRYAAAAMVFLAIGTFLAMPYFSGKPDTKTDTNVAETLVDTNNTSPQVKGTPQTIKPETKEIAENLPPKKEDITTAKRTQPKPFNLDSAMATLPSLPEKPLMPEKPKAGLIGIKQDLNEFPELKPYQEVLWAYVDADDEPLVPKDPENKAANTWNDAKIKKVSDNVYEMTLSRNKGKEVKTVRVKPVFKGEGYTKAMEKYNALMEQYNKTAEERAKKEAEFKMKAKTTEGAE